MQIPAVLIFAACAQAAWPFNAAAVEEPPLPDDFDTGAQNQPVDLHPDLQEAVEEGAFAPPEDQDEVAANISHYPKIPHALGADEPFAAHNKGVNLDQPQVMDVDHQRKAFVKAQKARKKAILQQVTMGNQTYRIDDPVQLDPGKFIGAGLLGKIKPRGGRRDNASKRSGNGEDAGHHPSNLGRDVRQPGMLEGREQFGDDSIDDPEVLANELLRQAKEQEIMQEEKNRLNNILGAPQQPQQPMRTQKGSSRSTIVPDYNSTEGPTVQSTLRPSVIVAAGGVGATLAGLSACLCSNRRAMRRRAQLLPLTESNESSPVRIRGLGRFGARRAVQ